MRGQMYGCSLVYGHPQGPTGARLIVEFLRTLRHRGGGVGLFTGWAAGDTGAAVVVPRRGLTADRLVSGDAAVNDLWPDLTEPAG